MKSLITIILVLFSSMTFAQPADSMGSICKATKTGQEFPILTAGQIGSACWFGTQYGPVSGSISRLFDLKTAVVCKTVSTECVIENATSSNTKDCWCATDYGPEAGQSLEIK